MFKPEYFECQKNKSICFYISKFFKIILLITQTLKTHQYIFIIHSHSNIYLLDSYILFLIHFLILSNYNNLNISNPLLFFQNSISKTIKILYEHLKYFLSFLYIQLFPLILTFVIGCYILFSNTYFRNL